MIYKEGWLLRRIKSASEEYNLWPDSIKKSLKLNAEEFKDEYETHYDDRK
ncbi:MAG: hypothetical protein RBT49_04230 [Bacteroidales bacterium]|jgi:hypothetical protein|nr:hypothetical protein [Bacteroidales bacterium]